MKKALILAAIVLAAGLGIWVAQNRQAQQAAQLAAQQAAAEAARAAEEAARAEAERRAAEEAARAEAERRAAELARLFTPEGFDAARLSETVAASSLDETTRSMALAVIEQIRANPALAEALLPRLQRLLGN